MIAVEGLTKRFGDTYAVEDVSFEVQPGQVVGFLGHNGAGKTTTLRMLLGHVEPDAGSATFFGQPIARLDHPLRRIGVMLDDGLHPGRTARDHMRVVAATGGLRTDRIDHLLETVGLADAAKRRCGGFSTGMRRRLGIAAALIAKPDVLVLDEPASGLDPEGIRWLRQLLQHVAADGCAVLVSSHHLAEIGQTADHVLVMDRGRLIASSSLDEVRREAGTEVAVRSPGAEVLAEELQRSGIKVATLAPDEVRARDVPARVVSELAGASGVPVWEVRTDEPSLEDAFFGLIERSRSGADDEPDGDDASGDNGAHDANGNGNGHWGIDHGPTPAAIAAEDAEPPSEADEELEQLENRLDARLSRRDPIGSGRVVAVVSPGRGLGRTTLAFLLADALSATARARSLAIALSCDSDRLTLPTSVEGRSKLALGDVLNDLTSFDEHARMEPYVSEVPSGAHTLSGVREPSALEALRPAHVTALTQFARRSYDVVVLDVGDVPGPALEGAVALADVVVVVGAPGDDALPDPDSPVLDVVARHHEEPSLMVVNQVPATPARPLVAASGTTDALVVPRDRMLIRALDAGGFTLGAAAPLTRVAVKRLALNVVERLA